VPLSETELSGDSRPASIRKVAIRSLLSISWARSEPLRAVGCGTSTPSSDALPEIWSVMAVVERSVGFVLGCFRELVPLSETELSGDSRPASIRKVAIRSLLSISWARSEPLRAVGCGTSTPSSDALPGIWSVVAAVERSVGFVPSVDSPTKVGGLLVDGPIDRPVRVEFEKLMGSVNTSSEGRETGSMVSRGLLVEGRSSETEATTARWWWSVCFTLGFRLFLILPTTLFLGPFLESSGLTALDFA